MGKTAKDIIDMASKYVGVKESPPNSNNVIFNTHYYGYAVNGGSYAWCCSFVWDIFRMCGASDLFYNGKKTAYCPSVYSWAKEEGLLVDITKAQPGDLVLFDWDKNGNPDHIGFILDKLPNGTYNTIEGNTSVGNDSNGGEVMIRNRNLYYIRAIVRPKYTQSANVVKPVNNTRVEFIKGVQKACGAVVDGIAGAETLSKTVTVSAYRNITHPVVRVIQTYFNQIGYNCGTVDGIAGQLFKNAVISYQKDNGCVADGEITAREKTWKKLLGMV